MDKIQLVKYKLRIIIIALGITVMVSSLLLIIIEFFEFKKLQERTINLKYKYHQNQINNDVEENQNNRFLYRPKSNLNKSLVATQRINYVNVSKEVLLPLRNYINLGAPICTIVKACTVSCRGGDIQEVIEAINSILENDSACDVSYKTLELNSVIFPENTLNSGWLQGLSTSINVLKIIKSTDLEELGDSAFSGDPFGQAGIPLSLTLTDTNIKHLRKASFNERQIVILEIKFSSMRQSITIEENLLGDTSFSVQAISIDNCLGSSEAIRNLTGTGNVLPGLKSLVLSYNMIEKLESDVFSKAPNLEQLFLESSGMNEIEVGAFKGLNKMILLHINSNKLKTVPEGLFNDLSGVVSLYLDNNPWNCTCELQWLKKYILSIPLVEYHRCRIGSEWVFMEDIEFCPSNSSTSKQTTKVTSPTTKVTLPTTNITTISPVPVPSTTPEYTSDFIFEKILCRNLLSYPFENITDDDANFLLISVFKRRNINFTISEIGNSLTYRVDLVGTIKPTDFLIWTNVENRADYGCIFNINSYILMNLQFQKTYTLCFSSNDTIDTYALIADDCTAISTPPDWSHRVWLNNNQKTAVILSIVFTFLATLAMASGAVYYLVKYNPELIKGNKRVLIVKRGSYSPNVLVLPSSKKKDAIRHVSLCTNQEGYLTPKLKHWAKNNLSDMRYHELDTISDKSIDEESGDNMIQMETNIDGDMNGEKNIYEYPPPLPPNHPSRRRDSGRPYFYSNM